MTDFQDWNTEIIAEFRANDGKVGGNFEGAPLLLLHHTGARSGQARITPMMYQDLGEGRVAVFASKAGADTHPAWYANLVAHPTVGVRRWENDELAEYQATAVVLDGAERDRVFEWIVQQAPGFGTYQTRTDRVIPVVALHPRRQTTPPRAGPLSPTPGDPS